MQHDTIELRATRDVSDQLSNTELSTGIALGTDFDVRRKVREAQRTARRREPSELLVDTVGDALGTQTFVEFSGGVDSSLVLSAAVRAAHQRHLPIPVPLTLRYGRAESDETSYQEAMIRHLDLNEWHIIEVDDELDLLSPDAVATITTKGVALAARISTRDWLLRQLPAGSVLMSGEGGDEVLGPAPFSSALAVRWAIANKWNRRTAVSNWVGAARRIVQHRGRTPVELLPDWLTPDGLHGVVAAMKTDARPLALTMKQWMQNFRSKRGIVDLLRELDEQCAAHGLAYSAPLLDIDFIAGLGASIPNRDHVERPLVVREHFADLVPEKIGTRTSKAGFNAAIFGEPTRSFALEWDGSSGVPLDLVDPERLRAAWLDGSDARSSLMLHSAYLAMYGRSTGAT